MESTLRKLADALNDTTKLDAATLTGNAAGVPPASTAEHAGTWTFETAGNDMYLNWKPTATNLDTTTNKLGNVLKDDKLIENTYQGIPSDIVNAQGIAADGMQAQLTTGADTPAEITFDLTALRQDGVNFKEGDQLTVNGKTYTFTTSPGADADKVDMGANFDAAINNLMAKLGTTLKGENVTDVAGTWSYSAGKLTFTANTANEIVDVAASNLGISNYTSASTTPGGTGNFTLVQEGADGVTAAINRDNAIVSDAPDAGDLMADANDYDTAGNGITFQIGANGNADQRVTLYVDDMSTEGLGLDGISVATQTAANNAIDVIDEAINTVSATRADLGALQNRLEHTINNLGVNSENLTAAESRIRDVDMAKEMMEFTKNNILTQAAQAMLAQANQQPQGVLQLLQ